MNKKRFKYKIILSENSEELYRRISQIDFSKSADAGKKADELIKMLHASIPDKKRISTGRYSVVMELGIFIHESGVLDFHDIPAAGKQFFQNYENDAFVRSLGIQLISLYAGNSGDIGSALELFRDAAGDKDWIVRECSSGFIRKLVKTHTELLMPWYHEMAVSENPMHRRFASESLRPVAENRWFRKSPGLAFSILEHLYTESSPYPRTSAGNSLSDWLRIDYKFTFPVIKRLAESGNPDSYWIAYRACRNLVKQNPLLVLDLLHTDEYRYKDRHFTRKDLSS